ncbi:MAG TPA: thioredoxin [Bacteroidales bacterium]|nr:thioredoxin [Bacteroidales bacterium]
MKKIGILLLAVVLNVGFAACNSNAAEKESTTEKTVNEKSAPAESANTATVIYLNKESFQKLVWNYTQNAQDWVYEGSLPAVIDFYADWCGPCKRVAPIMEKLAKEYKGRVVIYKVDTDANQELSSVFGIRSIPSVLFIPKNGKPAMQAGAMQEEQYKQIIEEFVLGNKAVQQ